MPDPPEDRRRAWSAMLAQCPDLACVLGADGRILEVNEAWQAHLGAAPDDVIGRELAELVHAEDRPRTQAWLQSDPLERGFVCRLPRFQRGDRWIEWSAHRDGDLVVALGRDRTEQRARQEALKESERAFRLMAENATDLIARNALDGTFLYVSPSSEALLGYAPEELLGEHGYALIHPEDLGALATGLERVMKDEGMVRMPYRLRSKDGRYTWFETHGRALRDERGEVVEFLTIARDVSGWREAEAALRESEQRLALATRSANFGVWDIDMATGVLEWDARMFELYDINPEGFSGTFEGWQACVHPDDMEGATAEFQAALAERRALDTEFRIVRSDGSVRRIRAFATTIYAEDDQPLRSTGINWDVTEEADVRQRLERSEAHLQEAQRIAGLGNWSCELETGDFSWSEQMYRIFGLDPAEAEPRFEDCARWFSEGHWSQLRAAMQLAAATGTPFKLQLPLHRPGGELVWVEFIGAPRPAAEGAGFLLRGTAQNVTAAKVAQEELRGREQRFRALVEQSADAVYVLDDDGRLLDVNPAATAMTGFDRERLLSMTVADLDPGATPSQVRKVMDGIEPGTSASLSGTHATIDGGSIPVDINVRCFEGPQGLRYLATARDVSGRIRAEAQRAELARQLADAQRAESLTVLAGGVAHDFNNLLVGVLGNVDLIREELGARADVEPLLDDISQAATRAAELARQMLAYSGQGRFVVEPANLAHLVEETVSMVRSSIPAVARLSLDLDDRIPSVHVDTTQLRQVAMNLVINAAEALEGAPGAVSVRVFSRHFDADALPTSIDGVRLAPGRFVCLEVEDDGVGIEPHRLTRIFEPFHSSKFTGRGLGLAAVMGIVRGHGGLIDVDSSVGEGTRFRVLLPVTDGSPRGARTPLPDLEVVATAPASADRDLILVVDDEAGVRHVSERMLRRLGFEVLAAASGEEAVSVFPTIAPRAVFVLLDMSMPGMNGKQTYEALRAIDEDVRVVMTSGFNEREVIGQLEGCKLAGFLQKPFRISTLRELAEGLRGEA